ncbi:MAG: threonylcarbamoyl-AMP synthase [Alphaproteobacteria bacterium]|nr:threonylcarbamoyl-AMP synthase [Alphaproteobacteria bacterium]
MTEPPTETALQKAAEHIQAGRLVAFPTETVYGLGADATNAEAVAAIFSAKERPSFNPLIIHVASAEAAERLVVFDDRATVLAEANWPGALTLVLPRREDCPVSRLAGAGLDTLALRVPAHVLAQQFLDAVGVPIAAPSANRSGTVSPTTADHVRESLGNGVDMIIDDGPCQIGLESTIVDLTTDTPTLLRAGGVTVELLERQIGEIQSTTDDDTAPKAPGMLSRHYATSIPLRMDAMELRDGEAMLAFGGRTLGPAPASCNLSRGGDVKEAAANLFDMMRQLDKPEYSGIAVMEIPETGLGRAINDRLRRASR